MKPLPYEPRKKKTKFNIVKLIDTYPKFEVEFYDCVSDVAQMIDKISDRDERIRLHKELTKIFAIRHKGSIMRLYREIYNLLNKTREGEING